MVLQGLPPPTEPMPPSHAPVALGQQKSRAKQLSRGANKAWRCLGAEIAWFENALDAYQPRKKSPEKASDAAPSRIDRHRFTRHRTIFISDTHLGTPGCKAEA